jgi:DNA-binding SARP family transcriptional activator
LRVQIQLLGGFSVAVDGATIPAESWRRERGAALVKLLAVSPEHRLHREQVMETFWPDLDREAAGANLRKAVLYARRALGAHALIDFEGDVVALSASALLLDTETFEAAAKEALRDPTPAACARAAELFGGELLPDDRYAAWLEETRQRLKDRYVRVLKAGKLWERLIELDPTDEEAQCSVMQAALDAGNRAQVIRLFTQLRERLRVDLGVGPSAAAVTLYERALASPAVEPVSAADRLRASVAWGLVHLHSGDFAKAEAIAREARALALAAGLARETGEASALLGLVAHMQGRWPQLFRSEFTEWVRDSSTFVSNVFDGHLCLAEFCLFGAGGHGLMAEAARELGALAVRVGSVAGRALSALIVGEVELFSGRLAEAERLLTDAQSFHEEVGAVAGRVMALQGLARIALMQGQRWRAGRFTDRAQALAVTTWLNPHLWIRLQGLAVEAATTPEATEGAVLAGDRALASGHTCQPCSMGFRTAAAIALAEAGALEQVGRRLEEAERLAGMWNGGPWVAALWEARGVERRAQGNEERALAAFSEAAARFGELGRPDDRARCEARIRGEVARARLPS